MTTALIDTLLTRDDVARETEKAILFVTSRKVGGGQLYSRSAETEIWLPKSKVTWVASVYGETAHIPAWLARRIG